ncbi:ImmA/IrrE family metallo-endopeptidase [Bacillus pseudomycoides]|uniref:ImmA/IrrE family metallo-endopeptidase n=1 Tax=Bacillus pseudomycoides TaxID=64104 RepID=UPI003F739B40
MDPYVNICICITPGSDITDDRIAKDLAVAESIWQPISFQIKDVIILNESFRFHDGEISYIDSIQTQPKVSSFFNTCSSRIPNCDIYICYIGSNYFKEQSVIACAYSFVINQILTGYIILTNAASPMKNIYTLAHEIGHILFTRRIEGKLTHADPHSQTGSEHHPSSTNLMYPIVPRPDQVHIDSLLTKEQRALSLQSSLLHKEKQ